MGLLGGYNKEQQKVELEKWEERWDEVLSFMKTYMESTTQFCEKIDGLTDVFTQLNNSVGKLRNRIENDTENCSKIVIDVQTKIELLIKELDSTARMESNMCAVEESQSNLIQELPLQNELRSVDVPSAKMPITYVFGVANGQITIRQIRPMEKANFELKESLDGVWYELTPLISNNDLLVMQKDTMLSPVFDLLGTGNKIELEEPALFKLQNEVWLLDVKGKITLK